MRHGMGGKLHIFVGWGDSNTYAGLNVDGSTSYDPTGLDTTDSRILEWRLEMNHPQVMAQCYTIVADSAHPFCLYVNPPVDSAVRGVGPHMAFAKAYIADGRLPANDKFVWVIQGVGGTGIVGGFYAASGGVGFSGSSTGLQSIADRVNALTTAHPNSVIEGQLVTTGANDGNNFTSRADELSSATISFAWMRANLTGTGASTAPILIQPLVPGILTTQYDPIRLAFGDLASSVSRCGVIDSTSLVGQVNPTFHLDSVSQRLVGSRGYTLWKSL